MLKNLRKDALLACTSTEEVHEYLEKGCYDLFTQAQGLGGAFCITAS